MVRHTWSSKIIGWWTAKNTGAQKGTSRYAITEIVCIRCGDKRGTMPRPWWATTGTIVLTDCEVN